MKNSRIHPASRAFTLIELLVVIAIIAILAGLLLTAGAGIRNNMIKKRAKAELQQVALAIDSYKLKLGYYPPDHPGRYSSNSLYFELVGCRTVKSGPNVVRFESLDKGITVVPGALNAVCGTLGVQNATTGASADEGGAALTFLKDLKPAQYQAVSGIPLLGVQLDGPLPLMIGGVLSPFFYNSSNPTNNPTSYDLWLDIIVGGKTNRISNWSPNPQIL